MFKMILIPASLVLFLGTRSFADTKPQAPVMFEDQVRPLLKAHCFECHGEGKKLKGGLDLRLVRLMRAGGDNGPALVAGKAEESLLLQRVRSHEMPPGDKKVA